MTLDADIHREDGQRDGDAGLGEVATTAGQTHWRGASGAMVSHAVYGLVDCPPLADAVYLLIRRLPGAKPIVLAIEVTETDVASLNLARVRHEGARSGATEVHVHTARRHADRVAIQRDLSRGLNGCRDDRFRAAIGI